MALCPQEEGHKVQEQGAKAGESLPTVILETSGRMCVYHLFYSGLCRVGGPGPREGRVLQRHSKSATESQPTTVPGATRALTLVGQRNPDQQEEVGMFFYAARPGWSMCGTVIHLDSSGYAPAWL